MYVRRSIDEGARTFTHGTYTQRWFDRDSSAVTVGLDPVRLVEMKTSVLNVGYSYDVSWNWDGFAGALELGINYCEGKQPAAEAAVDRNFLPVQVKATAIPRVTLPAAFVDADWRTVDLGDCAARIDGAEGGFTIYGDRGSAADATFRVVLSRSNDLFIEVEDDRFVSGDRGWATADHFEIWTAAPKACVDPADPPTVSEWAVRVLDGRVFSGEGHPAQLPSVEAALDGHRAHLRISLADLVGTNSRLAVVYSDSDDGMGPERLIATSNLASRDWWELGGTYDPFAAAGRTLDPECDIKVARLSPHVPPVTSAE